MYIKSFERAIIELAESVVYKHAKFVEKEYKLCVKDLTAAEKLEFVTNFVKINAELDAHIQEYLDDACTHRMYAESQWTGGYDE